MVQKIYNFNHISDQLNQEEVNKLKALYKTYHRLYKCYEMKYRRLKRLKLSLEMSSIFLTVSGIITGSVTLNPIILASISGSGILIQGYLTKSDINKRVNMCRFAYTSYQKILVQLKSYLRGIEYNENELLSDIKILDDIIISECPSIEKMSEIYNKKFIH